MKTFEEWFASHPENTGNNKLFRNKAGMKLAWEAAKVGAMEKMRDECANNLVKIAGNSELILNIYDKILDMPLPLEDE